MSTSSKGLGPSSPSSPALSMAASSSAMASSSSQGGISSKSTPTAVSLGQSTSLATSVSSMGLPVGSPVTLGLSGGLLTMGTPSGITSDHHHRPLPHPTMGVLPISLANCSCCSVVWNLATPHPKNGLSILCSFH